MVLGHSGHAEVPDVSSNKLKNREHLFNLQGQLRHKFDFIKQLDRKCNLHLIGHSIGAWMVSEIMLNDDKVTERVLTAHLLFPTLQKLAESRNGIFVNSILRRLHIVLMSCLAVVDLLPEYAKLWFIGLYCRFYSLPKHHIRRIRMFINPNIVEQVLFLAYDEMDTVKSLNVNALDKIKHVTNILYSVDDGWVPMYYMDDLKHFQPELYMTAVNIDHAFVLKSSEKVAKIVTEWIKTSATDFHLRCWKIKTDH